MRHLGHAVHLTWLKPEMGVTKLTVGHAWGLSLLTVSVVAVHHLLPDLEAVGWLTLCTGLGFLHAHQHN